jgi:ABC-type molybdate transport system ATPase subunit
LPSKVDAAVGYRGHALIRPEDVTFTTSRDVNSARNVFEGRIIRMTLMGPLVLIEVFCGVPLLGVLMTVSAQELGFK